MRRADACLTPNFQSLDFPTMSCDMPGYRHRLLAPETDLLRSLKTALPVLDEHMQTCRSAAAQRVLHVLTGLPRAGGGHVRVPKPVISGGNSEVTTRRQQVITETGRRCWSSKNDKARIVKEALPDDGPRPQQVLNWRRQACQCR